MNHDERRRRVDESLSRGPIGPDADARQRAAWFDEAAEVNELMVAEAREWGNHELAAEMEDTVLQARLEARRAVRGLN